MGPLEAGCLRVGIAGILNGELLFPVPTELLSEASSLEVLILFARDTAGEDVLISVSPLWPKVVSGNSMFHSVVREDSWRASGEEVCW